MASIIGKGDGEGLRRVEKDVLITKKVKHKAMEKCADLVKGAHYFVPCIVLPTELHAQTVGARLPFPPWS
jgi:hypothetical protein